MSHDDTIETRVRKNIDMAIPGLMDYVRDFFRTKQQGRNLNHYIGPENNVQDIHIPLINNIERRDIFFLARALWGISTAYEYRPKQDKEDSDKILKNSSMEYLLETLYGIKTLDGGKRGVKLSN